MFGQKREKKKDGFQKKKNMKEIKMSKNAS